MSWSRSSVNGLAIEPKGVPEPVGDFSQLVTAYVTVVEEVARVVLAGRVATARRGDVGEPGELFVGEAHLRRKPHWVEQRVEVLSHTGSDRVNTPMCAQDSQVKF